jgi:hypothetical protein
MAMRGGEGRIRVRKGFFHFVLITLGIVGSLVAWPSSPLARQAGKGSTNLDVTEAGPAREAGAQRTYQAENPKNNLHVAFSTSGVRITPRSAKDPAWSVDLALTGIGRDRPVTIPGTARLSASGNRIDYEFNNVRQWYVNAESSLEQGFRLSAPPGRPTPDGATSIVLDLSIGGELEIRQVQPSYFVDFVTPGGENVLRYGPLRAKDANGTILEARLEIRADVPEEETRGVRIIVEAADAAYPLEIEAALSAAASESQKPEGEPGGGSGEMIGVPVTLEQGITESVDEIMRRERLAPAAPLARPRETHHELEYEAELQEDPKAPAVSHWPPHTPGPIQESAPLVSGPPSLPQSLGTSFKAVGVSESGYIPPDSMGDVGPAQIVVHVNGRIKTFDKTGVADGALNASDAVFWASVAGTGGISDPEVRYDRLSGRWFILGITVAEVVNNKIVIAVSSGSTISSLGSFTFYSFPVGTPSPSDAASFCDYPSLGVDANALYTGCNMFSSAGGFRWTSAFVIRKSSVTGGGPIVVTGFANLTGGCGVTTSCGVSPCTVNAGPYSPRGVDNDDPQATEGYILGTDLCFLSRLEFRRVSNPGGAPTLSANIAMTVPTTTNMATQQALDSTTNVDPSDSRLFKASISKNKLTGVSSLWTAHSLETNTSCVGSASGGTRRIGARWHEIGSLTATPTLTQSGTLCTTVTGSNSLNSQRGFLYPSVVETGQGHMALGASSASALAFVGVATAGRLRTDPPAGTRAPESIVVDGLASYTINDPSGRNRWGDYSFTDVDPNDDQTVWTFQEYADVPANNWSVRVVQLLAPPPPALATATPVCTGLASTTSTITGTDNCAAPTCTSGLCTGGGTCPEFFDPGPDTGGPGYASHLTATVTGGVTVNPFPATGIVIPGSPSTSRILQATLSLNTTAAAPGTRNITITNPDGQSTTGIGILTVNQTPATPAASSNGPICAGQTLQLNAPTVPGATYGWTGPNGFASSLQNPSIPGATAAASGVYSVTVTVGGCLSNAGTTPATVIAAGESCNDGSLCTAGDVCQVGGSCTGTPVVCTASDQCHDVGTCDTGSGICSNPPKADGSTCDDANACTQTDTCQAAACTGSNPVVCTASDQCHDVGTCDTGSGICSNPPKADGTGCEDGNACTVSDTCQSGACQAGPPADVDGDAHVSGLCGGDDCNDVNPLVWLSPVEVTNLLLTSPSPADPSWDSQATLAGPETSYDLISGLLGPGAGVGFSSGSCLQSSGPPSYSDIRPGPFVGEAFWYLARGRNSCGTGTYGSVARDASAPACP